MTQDVTQLVHEAIATLKEGGVIIYPTDTVYGLGCDIFNKAAIEKIYRLKKRDKNKPMSIICSDLSNISEYAIVPTYAYRIMKRALPGPYTFILKATKKTPKLFISKNKTVGIRIPNNEITRTLVEELGNPIITTSVNISGEPLMVTPKELSKEFRNQIDTIIDIGQVPNDPSTIIDLSGNYPEIIREGSGDTSFFK
jgi:tRNA threonylcarbamoyl adenosine modification protein (Sua5/YciO/YrdC/YwlC family)